MTGLWRRRRLVLSLALCLVTVLFATVVVRTWSSTPERSTATPTPLPSPSTPTHATYRFYLDGFPPGPLHPGQRITLRWATELADPASTAPAADVVCWLSFYGPWASEADATKVATSLVQQDPAAGPTPAFFSEPRFFSDRTREPQSVLLTLPTALRPGIYVAMYQAKNSGNLTSEGGYFLLRLAARGLLVGLAS
jgi:hypothetical protein